MWELELCHIKMSICRIWHLLHRDTAIQKTEEHLRLIYDRHWETWLDQPRMYIWIRIHIIIHKHKQLLSVIYIGSTILKRKVDIRKKVQV